MPNQTKSLKGRGVRVAADFSGRGPAVAAAGNASHPVATSAKGSPWIVGRWLDLLLFVGTPALLIPLCSAAQIRWAPQDIFLFVGAFGATGHHLPGMIRAYGDRALFQRFRIRFVVAPLALLAVCMWSSFYDVRAIQLVALGWGIWHGLMQTYGFGRIYDAKAAARAPERARFDFALCLAWFSGAVIVSPLRFRSCVELFYESGGPVLPTGFFAALRIGVWIALALVTSAFVWRQWRDIRAKRGFSAVKILLFASSISFWWYCNNGVQNILVGIALFEVFHDVQYLSIVWIYNLARVERDKSIGGFMRFIFRRSGALMGVYVGLVLAYGSIGFVSSGLAAEWTRHVLVGLLTASALLHFYYDGFIWKVRESQTGTNLGIGGGDIGAGQHSWPLWARHSLRWAVLIIPVAVLSGAQFSGKVVPPLDRLGKTAEAFPDDPKAQLEFGEALQDAGKTEEAIRLYEKVIKLDPHSAEAHFLLGLAWSDLGDLDRSITSYEIAMRLDPTHPRSEVNLANVLMKMNRRGEARQRYEHVLALDPTLVLAQKSLGDLLLDAGEYDAAIAHYTEACRLNPNVPGLKDNLSFARSLAGR